MRKIIALGISTLAAGTLVLTAPAAQAAPIIPGVCAALPAMVSTANAGVITAGTALTDATADLNADRDILDGAVAEWVSAAVDWLQAIDTGVGNVATLESIMNSKLANVGTAASAWSQSVVAAHAAEVALDAAQLQIQVLSQLLSELCA
jgi:hypothetical protein